MYRYERDTHRLVYYHYCSVNDELTIKVITDKKGRHTYVNLETGDTFQSGGIATARRYFAQVYKCLGLEFNPSTIVRVVKNGNLYNAK